jgi:formylglycine-generating enzyme required for sulfatase activity
MGIYPVRNRDFRLFLDSTKHPVTPCWSNPDFNHPDQPVVAVSWIDACAYCSWLSEMTSRNYRLLSEAQWEWAARGGCEGFRYSWGNQRPEEHSDYLRRWSGNVRHPAVVGTGAPNPVGLYDIGENIHEWRADWFNKNYYEQSPACDPQGPVTGECRASRGGSWRHQIKVSRCAARSSIPPTFQYSDYGFRVVRDALLEE